jgi:hypothetical protein
MNPDVTSFEADLREIQARALDDALLSRLDAAADGTWTKLSLEEIRFENLLRKSSPTVLTADFLAKLEGIVAQVPFNADEKVVVFPRTKIAYSPRKARPIWAAAAAVALIGAATALMIPTVKLPQQTARQAPAASPAFTPPSVGNLVPASFNRGLSAVSDEGIVWKSNKQPHNVVRVSYEEKITLKDETGKTYQVVQPRVQYMLVPAKTD